MLAKISLQVVRPNMGGNDCLNMALNFAELAGVCPNDRNVVFVFVKKSSQGLFFNWLIAYFRPA